MYIYIYLYNRYIIYNLILSYILTPRWKPAESEQLVEVSEQDLPSWQSRGGSWIMDHGSELLLLPGASVSGSELSHSDFDQENKTQQVRGATLWLHKELQTRKEALLPSSGKQNSGVKFRFSLGWRIYLTPGGSMAAMDRGASSLTSESEMWKSLSWWPTRHLETSSWPSSNSH